MADEALKIEIEGFVARLTLNRPNVGNAINADMVQALSEATDHCVANERIRCVVLSGAGSIFCSGGDIEMFAAAGKDVPRLFEDLARHLHRTVLSLARMQKPLLVLVNGPAAGVGLSLALLGDVVLASRAAHFAAAYSTVGLSPDGGMSWLLPRVAGLRRAQEMILTNRRIDAEEAERFGIVTRVLEEGRLQAEGLVMAQRLAKAPTRALGSSRHLLNCSFETSFERHLEQEALTIASAAGHGESREGIAAFLERRAPRFQDVDI